MVTLDGTPGATSIENSRPHCMATGRNGTLGKLLHGLQVRLEMPCAGLDLGEIENLVDQRSRSRPAE